MQKNATAPYVQTPGKHHFCTLFVIMILHPLIESPKPPQYQIMGCLTLTVKRSSHQLTAGSAFLGTYAIWWTLLRFVFCQLWTPDLLQAREKTAVFLLITALSFAPFTALCPPFQDKGGEGLCIVCNMAYIYRKSVVPGRSFCIRNNPKT